MLNKISIIGLGYVGLPLALEFAKKYRVVAFDVNDAKINLLKKNIDFNKEVDFNEYNNIDIMYSNDTEYILNSDFYIVAVPTPINMDKTPDLYPLIEATKTVGKCMKQGAIVVFESTVYPGTTEEICVPILEEVSGLKFGVDFKVGYSPERINPGDKKNTLKNIVKVVSGSDSDALEQVANLYESIIDAGVYRAKSIKIAEAAKIIENSQRDVNIAFMNEIAIILNKMDVNIHDVLEAAKTKWNFINFTPGLVGGHCIGVDPYYFIYKAEQLGCHSDLISVSRRINDEMSSQLTALLIKKLIQNKINLKNFKTSIIGITFKENCKDVRNTKIINIIKELNEYGLSVNVYDPIADKNEVLKEYQIDLVSSEEVFKSDLIILAVPHDEVISNEEFKTKLLSSNMKILFDLKGVLKKEWESLNHIKYWTL